MTTKVFKSKQELEEWLARRDIPEDLAEQVVRQFQAQSIRKHAGPGNHPSGSPQDVHGGESGQQSIDIEGGIESKLTSRFEALKSKHRERMRQGEKYHRGFATRMRDTKRFLDRGEWNNAKVQLDIAESIAGDIKDADPSLIEEHLRHNWGLPEHVRTWDEYKEWKAKKEKLIGKHAAPIHPGTGTDQSAHGGGESKFFADTLQWEPTKATMENIPKRSGDPGYKTLLRAGRAAAKEKKAMIVGQTALAYWIKAEDEIDKWDQGVRWKVGVDGVVVKLKKEIKKHGGPGPHKSGSPQSVHGAWSRGLSARQRISDIEEEGGFTIHVPTGSKPKSGFAIALPGHEFRTKIKKLTERVVQRYRRDHAKALNRKDTSWGAWFDTESGDVFLDISIVVDDEAEARRLGKKYKQIAIFNLGTFEEIRLAS